MGGLDEATSQLFFAILPVFICALPQLDNHAQIKKYELENGGDEIKEQLLLFNVLTRLRQTIRQAPKYYNPACLAQSQTLSEDECGDAADALDLILSKFETLVDVNILDTGSHDKVSKFEKLSILRDLAAGSTWQDPEDIPAVSLQSSSLVSYLQANDPATEVVQYRRIAKQAEDFSKTMQQIFASKDAINLSSAGQLVSENRHSKASDEESKRSHALLAARRLDKISRRIADLMLSSGPETCTPPHSTMVHLSGFAEPEIDTLVTLCKAKKSLKKIRIEEEKSQKWHVVTWCHGDECPGSCGTALCEKFRSTHKKRYSSKVLIRHDGSWSSPLSSRLGSFATAPNLTLESLLTPQDGPTMKKKERLDLAVKISSSLFHLIWSPLVQSPWSTATIHVMKTSTESSDLQPYVQGYLLGTEGDHETQASLPSRKPLILDLALLLWELFFGRKIVATAEDGLIDSDDEGSEFSETVSSDGSESMPEDDEDPRFNALCRELDTANEACVDTLCLNIISDSVDIYARFEDYSSETDLRKDIYSSIMRPLLEYVGTYNINTRPHSKKAKATTAIGSQTLLQPRFVANKQVLEDPRSRIKQIKEFVGVFQPVHRQSQSGHMSSTLSGALLSSNRTTASSADWLERFDNINQQLQFKNKLSHPVKIAILDTGCDLENDFFAGPGVDFVDDIESTWIDYVRNNSSPVDEDPGRHGTALAALLLRVLPKRAALRVARVARDASTMLDARHNTAKAITESVAWGADIICMSYGFGTEAPAVQAAITEAEQDRHGRILFFAAANNDGLNEPELFPAWLENVISVRGTHHDGSFVDKYNPNSWRHKRGLTQFGTLAANVPCGWLSDDLTKSGCSVATPILAAIAALVISYVGTFSHDLDARAFDLIRTRRGIESVFYEMAENQSNKERLYLTPWFLFNGRNPIHLIGHALGKVPQHDVH